MRGHVVYLHSLMIYMTDVGTLVNCTIWKKMYSYLEYVFIYLLCFEQEPWNLLTHYSTSKPLRYHVFENIMENGAFALKVFKT